LNLVELRQRSIAVIPLADMRATRPVLAGKLTWRGAQMLVLVPRKTLNRVTVVS